MDPDLRIKEEIPERLRLKFPKPTPRIPTVCRDKETGRVGLDWWVRKPVCNCSGWGLLILIGSGTRTGTRPSKASNMFTDWTGFYSGYATTRILWAFTKYRAQSYCTKMAGPPHCISVHPKCTIKPIELKSVMALKYSQVETVTSRWGEKRSRVSCYCGSPRLTWALPLSDQHLDLPQLWPGWIIQSSTDSDRLDNNVGERQSQMFIL